MVEVLAVEYIRLEENNRHQDEPKALQGSSAQRLSDAYLLTDYNAYL